MATPLTVLERELAALPGSLAGGLRIVAVRSGLAPSEVDDAVQETLLRALEAIRAGRVPEGVALGAYVRGILRHVLADHARRGRRDAAPSLDPARIAAPGRSPLEALVAREEVDAVRAALRRLEGPERELLERVYARGERIVDVAEQTGEPAERLRKRKSRALERLRRALDRRG